MVAYNQNNVLSITIDDFSNAGGPHPSKEIEDMNMELTQVGSITLKFCILHVNNSHWIKAPSQSLGTRFFVGCPL